MKRLAIVVAFALVACAQEAPAPDVGGGEEPALEAVALPLADQAGNRMEALTQNGDRWCSADSAWCVEANETTASVIHGDETIGLVTAGAAWPAIIRTGEDAIVGIVTTDEQMYSGGGASAAHLTLFEIADGAAREVLRMPYAASAMIRACFSEEDQAARAEACHDQYTFVTRISLDEANASGAPILVLETAAGSFPGAVTRTADSRDHGPLSEADLVWARDRECTFRRTYTRGADGLYAPDQPVPGCSDYLEP